MKLNVLMIDDHPTQIEGYKGILNFHDAGHELHFTQAHSCEEAYHVLTEHITPFDVLCLDWSLPPYPEAQIMNGEDVGALARERFPKIKILMMTSHSEAFILYNIVKMCAPEALMVKSDFSANDFLTAFDTILAGKTYMTPTAAANLRNVVSKSDYLDSYNRQIIQLLSQGVLTKNIPQIVRLSQSAVEKRKASIKDYFGIAKGTDEEIVREARRRGYI